MREQYPMTSILTSILVTDSIFRGLLKGMWKLRIQGDQTDPGGKLAKSALF